MEISVVLCRIFRGFSHTPAGSVARQMCPGNQSCNANCLRSVAIICIVAFTASYLRIERKKKNSGIGPVTKILKTKKTVTKC